jgi:hypothetical protein
MPFKTFDQLKVSARKGKENATAFTANTGLAGNIPPFAQETFIPSMRS